MLHALPKILSLGTNYIQTIFEQEVEITEKIDGSQFSFGITDEGLEIRSKNAALYVETCDNMFVLGVEYVSQISHLLTKGLTYHGEFLKSQKHNVLTYGRVPKNNIMLYAVRREDDSFVEDLEPYGKLLGLEIVPVIFRGKIANITQVRDMMDRDSILGGAKMEGLVVKNFKEPLFVGNRLIPLMMGKMVSTEFKEVHRENWGKDHSGHGRMEEFLRSFNTEARFHKAIQHLDEQGLLVHEAKDIGALIKEIHRDVVEEEKENIKNFLWGEFSRVIKGRASRGFVEFYKGTILKDNTF